MTSRGQQREHDEHAVAEAPRPTARQKRAGTSISSRTMMRLLPGRSLSPWQNDLKLDTAIWLSTRTPVNATMPSPSSGSSGGPMSGVSTTQAAAPSSDPPALSASSVGRRLGSAPLRSGQEVGRCKRQPAGAEETCQRRQHPEQRKRADPDRAGGAGDHQRRQPHGEQGAEPGAEIGQHQSGDHPHGSAPGERLRPSCGALPSPDARRRHHREAASRRSGNGAARRCSPRWRTRRGRPPARPDGAPPRRSPTGAAPAPCARGMRAPGSAAAGRMPPSSPRSATEAVKSLWASNATLVLLRLQRRLDVAPARCRADRPVRPGRASRAATCHDPRSSA